MGGFRVALLVKAKEDTNETKRTKRPGYGFGYVARGKLSQRDLTTSFKTLIPRYEGGRCRSLDFLRRDATSLGEPF